MHANNVVTEDSTEVKQALTLMTGRSTFPNIFINGQSIGGGDEVASMQQTGQLVDVLTQADVLA
jgi:glutaredoxin 3